MFTNQLRIALILRPKPMWLVASLQALLALCVILSRGAKDECLKSYSNLLLTCARPFQSQLSSTEEHCRRLCIASYPRSRSCQYDSFSEGIDSSCDPSMIPSIGFVFLVPLRNCSNSSEKFPTLIASHLASDSPLPSFGSSFPQTSPTFLPIEASRPYYSSKDGFHQHFKPQLRHPMSDCSPSYTPRFEIVDGIEVVAEGIAKLFVSTPQACMYACGMNMLLDGTPLTMLCHSAQFERMNARCTLFDVSISPTGSAQYNPNVDVIYFEKICISACSQLLDGTPLTMLCHSAQFERMNARCTLFDVSISPTGSAQYNPNVDVIYFEKICISENAANHCRGTLRRVPQYVLLSHASAVVDAPTHSSCIEKCMVAPVEFGFECRSAIHFYEVPTANCILNVHSARTRPPFFVVEKRQKVDYIEMSDCQARQKDLPWTEWSDCDEESGVRWRQRNCTSCSSEVEQLPCFSATTFQKQFAQLVHEQDISESGQRFVEIDNAITEQRIPHNSSDQKYVKQILPTFQSASDRSSNLIQGNEIHFFGPPFHNLSADGTHQKRFLPTLLTHFSQHGKRIMSPSCLCIRAVRGVFMSVHLYMPVLWHLRIREAAAMKFGKDHLSFTSIPRKIRDKVWFLGGRCSIKNSWGDIWMETVGQRSNCLWFNISEQNQN
ncbi:Uncharacterized protein F52C9.5 [Toxocara canis]|uniref:Uncharacterized protein F52C9.5 n=1 Tax=Toxocara canis TaxID=6265 RepID=A0A0B2VE70_TOXCA|nr:Uncharacterized protein F52C9.5 [Toxocara canis]